MPRSVASRFEHLLRHDPRLPHGATETMVNHLADIEAMEAKLGTDEVPPEQLDELVNNCHRLINEVQRLHLASHLKEAAVTSFALRITVP